ncbi:MAG: ATP-binding protein [Gammaproteobacteria bacterium]
MRKRLFTIVNVILALFAVVLITINWVFAPEFYSSIVSWFGPILFLICGVTAIVAIAVLARFLYKQPYGGVMVYILITLLLVSYGTAMMHHTIQQRVHRYIQQLVDQTSNLVKVEVDSRLHFRLFGLIDLAKQWSEGGSGVDRSAWMKEAERVYDFFPGYQSLEWVDEDGLIQWVWPQGSDLTSQSFLSTIEPRRTAAMNLAKERRESTVSQTVSFVQGGQGFVAFVPIYYRNAFFGYIAGKITYQALFSHIFSEDVIPLYNIRVSTDQGVVFQRGEASSDIEKRWEHSFSINFHGLNLHLEVWPTHQLIGREGRYIPRALILLGILFMAVIVLAGGIVVVMQRYTDDVEGKNEQLQHEMDDRKKAEEAREQMKMALMQAQKLEAIGTLAGGIAHNFNNILYSIKGYAQMVRDDLEPDTQQHKNLGQILEASGRAEELVKSIMSFSRQESYKFDTIQMKDVINSTFNLMKPTLPATVEIRADIRLDKEKVHGNHTQLQQVFMNIIRNAVDAMNGAGVITISAKEIKLSRQLRAAYPNLTYSRYIEIKIADTGGGIDESVLQRIFEPFYTTKEVGKGTGLGLATSLSIVHDHQGEIIVESEAGEGTTFTILLPELQSMGE